MLDATEPRTVAGFPFALGGGDRRLAVADKVPPHHDRLLERPAAEEEHPGPGTQGKLQFAPPLPEVGEFVGMEMLACERQVAAQRQQAVLEIRVQLEL